MINSKILKTSILVFTILSMQANAAEESKTLPKVTVTADLEEEANGYKTEASSSSLRTDTPLLDTPQSVAVVGQDQIRDQNITKLEEAARYVPGVNVQLGEGHRDQVTIRGMGGSDKGTTSNFFVDGARDDAEYIRDFYNTEKIEFLKGPNAMAFGRGSPGGVINRVLKTADGKSRNRFVITGGSFDNRRVEGDVGGKINDKVAIRLNSMYQKSNSYRDHVEFEKYAFNPTATIDISEDTELKVGYEHFDDERFNDRGIPSLNSKPYATSSATFFGNPNANKSTTKINAVYASISHDFDDTLNLKNYTRYSVNNKYYQNVVPDGISGNNLTLDTYNSSTKRDIVTNQTDITKKFTTGSINHKALFGMEVTRQSTNSLRLDGTFSSNGMDSITVPLSNPINYDDVTYSTIARSSKSDVDILAGYLQDQMDLNKYVQLTAGLRVDRFRLKFRNRVNDQAFKRVDTMLSPRAGLVVKPREELSLYSSYGVTYVPASGDQFSSLDANSKNLKPEKIQSYELGAKWDVNPKFNVTTAIFEINRTNTQAADPNNSGFSILTGESRTRGFELAAAGKITDKWEITGGYTFQDARITSATEDYNDGSRVALVPHNTFSLWNKYAFTNKFSAALGIITQSDQYAAADNSTRLEGFTRFDGALYYKINKNYKLQANIENIFDKGYILTAHNNKNILPGSPRAFNVTLIADF